MEPVRTCVGCKKLGTRNSLIRLVSAEGRVVVDLGKKLSGRGAWLHGNQECLKLAVDRKAFGRALGGQFETDVQALTKSIEQAETMLAKNE
ncbi:MAG: hypothetical protein RL140_322 [Actinomycetota bacterium]|jgi:predicted RNA-binding protein YlxR (DUF448 family)